MIGFPITEHSGRKRSDRSKALLRLKIKRKLYLKQSQKLNQNNHENDIRRADIATQGY